MILLDNIREAEGDAGGDFTVIFSAFNIGGDHAKMFTDGAGGSDIFPFKSLAVVSVFSVAGLKGVRSLSQFVILNNTTADTSTEGEKDSFTTEAISLKN